MIESGNATESSTDFIYSDWFIYVSTTFASVFSGLAESLQWVAIGKYISDCATLKTKGFYFGLFWSIYMTSQIFGNLIASFVLEKMNIVFFYFLMSIFAGVSAFLFAFL